MDAWDGYKVSRDKLLDFIDTRKIANPIVITGDVHQNWAADLLRDFRDAASKILGSEFIGTSISTTGDGSDTANAARLTENPWIKFNNQQRGYVQVSLDQSTARPTTASCPTSSARARRSPQEVVRRRSRQPGPEGRVNEDRPLARGRRRRVRRLPERPRGRGPAAGAPAARRGRAADPVPRVLRRRHRRHRHDVDHPPRVPHRRPRARPTRSSTTTTATAAARRSRSRSRTATPTASPRRSCAGRTSASCSVSIDGRQLGAPFDLYAATLQRRRRRSRSARVALSEGKHMLTMTVIGKNDGVDRLPRRHRPAGARLAGRAGSRRRPRSRRPRWARRCRRRSR